MEEDLSPSLLVMAILDKKEISIFGMTENEILDMFEGTREEVLKPLQQSEYIGPCPFGKKAKAPGQLIGPPELAEEDYPYEIELPLLSVDIEQLAKHRKLKPAMQNTVYVFFGTSERQVMKNTVDLYANKLGIKSKTPDIIDALFDVTISFNNSKRRQRYESA